MPFKTTQDSDDISEYHVILRNFEFKDFQFKGELLNSGFKVYRDEHNFMNELFLLIECEMSYDYYMRIDDLDKKKFTDQDNQKIELSSQEKNIIFYE